MTLEPGHDSPRTTGVYKDLFALTLEYFNGDYQSRNLNATAPAAPGASRYDGTIQAAAWRTAASADIQRMAYAYDEKSQLQNSVYSNWQLASPASTTYQLNSTVSAQALQEGGMSYDPNGNLLTLRRTNQRGDVTDNFSYTYKANTNQLKEVHTGSSTGATVLDYDYDELGQLTRQRDEQGQRYLTYDVTGKTTGMYADASHNQPLVTFAYDDRGFRVSKTAFSASFAPTRTTYYVRDVAGNILAVYDKPAATGVVQRSEVPLYGSGRLGTLIHLNDDTPTGTDDYRYELTDHLGDARVVFHRPTTDVGPESFESTSAKYAFQLQGAGTYGYASSKALSAPNVALLGNASAATGTLRRTVSVQKGDTITFTAWARTTGGFSTPTIVASPAPAATAARVQPFLLLGAAATTDETPTRLEDGRLTRSQAGASNWLGRLAVGLSFTLGRKQPAAPSATATALSSTSGTFNAWLQYQVKDANGQPVGQPQQVLLPSDNPTTWQQLRLGVRVQQGGSVELIASSAETSSYVMFDNLTVEQTGSLIVQEQHQYAFGAPLPGLSYTVGNRRYRYGYQGQFAEHDDETGFESFELRLYNSRVGRWMSYDPEGQFDSPYVGMSNNPIGEADPDGGWSWFGAAAGAVVGGGIGGIISSASGGSFWKGAAIGAGAGFIGGGLFGPKLVHDRGYVNPLDTRNFRLDWGGSTRSGISPLNPTSPQVDTNLTSIPLPTSLNGYAPPLDEVLVIGHRQAARTILAEGPVGNARITSLYGAIRPSLGGAPAGAHPGTDFGVWAGFLQRATADGVVARSYLSSSYGNVIILNHGRSAVGLGNIYTLYAHGMTGGRLVESGSVRAGQPILRTGSTGFSTAPHAHYEVIRTTLSPFNAGFFGKGPNVHRYPPQALPRLLGQ